MLEMYDSDTSDLSPGVKPKPPVMNPPPYSTIMPSRFTSSNFTTPQEHRSLQEDYQKSHATSRYRVQAPQKFYNTQSFDDMADDMFDIQVSPQRDQNIN